MAQRIQRVEYFSTTIDNKPGQGYWLLARLKRREVNLLAFNAFPYEPGASRLDFFPDDAEKLIKAAGEINVKLSGPKRAFLVQGEDKIGALSDIFERLYEANINIHAVNCVCDDRGGYGFVLWVTSRYYEDAAEVLGV